MTMSWHCLEVPLRDVATHTEDGDIIVQICYPCEKWQDAVPIVCPRCLRYMIKMIMPKSLGSTLYVPLNSRKGKYEIL